MKRVLALTLLMLSYPAGLFAQCLSGDCNNGFGKMDLGEGNVYEGTFKDGKRHGFGTLKIGSGATYIGEFINEQMWGIGIIYGNSGEYLQSGLYKDNKLTTKWPEQIVKALVVSRAKLSETPTADKCIDGNCQNGFGVRVDSDGSSYGGMFVSGKFQGWGHLKTKGGAEYIGFFDNDAMAGIGVVYGNSGELLKNGMWEKNNNISTIPEAEVLDRVMPPNNLLSSYTSATSSSSTTETNATTASGSKERCDGNCTNGKGKKTDSEGNTFEGQWINGKLNGPGVMQLPNGVKYTGEFKDDSMHGYGIIYRADGSVVQSGIYETNNLKTSMTENEVKDILSKKKSGTSNTYASTSTSAPATSEAKNLTAQVKELVDQKMKEWEVKGEFEKSDAYQARVNAKTKSEQTEKFKKEALQSIGNKTVNWSNPQAKYDADKELFTVNFDNKYPIYIKVSIDKAKSFATNIKSVQFTKAIFTQSGNELVLTQVEANDNESIFMGFNTMKDALAYVPPAATAKAGSTLGGSIVSSSEYKNKIALVIGNSEYPNAPLKNPGNDATAISNELKSLGFDVIHYNNAGRKVFREAIHEFGEKLSANKGIGLFYYAGHGLQSDGVNYLVPVDAIVEKDYDIQDECIRADVVLRMMELNHNPMNIIILDACRNNPFMKSSRSINQGLAQPESAPTGSIIAFATAPGKTASDGEGGNGLYTQELIKAMRKPGLSIEQIFKEVRINVSKLSGDKQVPWENSSLMGDFYFRKN